MKWSFGARQSPANLSDWGHQQLDMYALAASAAGVGMLVLAQPAQATIVYTPTHKVIGLNGSYNLDLNRDGITDFRIYEHDFYSVVYNDNFLSVEPQGSNGVVGRHYAAALNSEEQIRGGQYFYHRTLEMCDARSGSRRGSFGPWVNVTNRYLGLKFIIKGKIHYGWARLTVKSKYGDMHITAILTGYAYETIPTKRIITGRTKGPDQESSGTGASVESPLDTPQPATLGALAMGAPGLSIWRREERTVEAQ